MTPEDGPMPAPYSRGYRRALGFALFMVMFADTYGLILLVGTPVLLMFFDQSAGSATALGVCGLGLVTWARRR